MTLYLWMMSFNASMLVTCMNTCLWYVRCDCLKIVSDDGVRSIFQEGRSRSTWNYNITSICYLDKSSSFSYTSFSSLSCLPLFTPLFHSPSPPLFVLIVYSLIPPYILFIPLLPHFFMYFFLYKSIFFSFCSYNSSSSSFSFYTYFSSLLHLFPLPLFLLLLHILLLSSLLPVILPPTYSQVPLPPFFSPSLRHNILVRVTLPAVCWLV